MNQKDTSFIKRSSDDLYVEIYGMKCELLALREYVIGNIGNKSPEVVKEELEVLTKKYRNKNVSDLKKTKTRAGLAFRVQRGDTMK